MLDIAILLKTPFKAFNKSEKYIEKEIKDYPELYRDPIPEILEIYELMMGENEEEQASASSSREEEPEQMAMDIAGEQGEAIDE